jgi:hypothetical protein
MSAKKYTIADLRMEQLRLKHKIRRKEEEISDKVGFLRRNYPAILLYQVMPFDKAMNDTIIKGLGWAMQLFFSDIALKGKEITGTMFEKLSVWFQSLFSRFKKDNESEMGTTKEDVGQ